MPHTRKAAQPLSIRLYKPTARECALLLAHLLLLKGESRTRTVSQARLSQLTLRRLWIRSEITDILIREVNEWLSHAGWVIFSTGTAYAAVRLDKVETWGRTSSKRLATELADVALGRFNFSPLEELLLPVTDGQEEDEDPA